MLDLYEEFKAIIAALSEPEIDYAVCGGLAMAVYGLPRATVDIDLLILADDFGRVKQAVQPLGYTIEAQPMRFAKGAIEIRRLSKIDAETGIVLPLDLLLVTPQIERAWQTRTDFEWDNGKLRIVSREGLVDLKTLRGSGQDLDDISRLNESRDES